MKNALLFLLASVVSFLFLGNCLAENENLLSPKEDEVAIYFNCIEIPLERMLLIRKNSSYCAAKFTRGWVEKEGNEEFAECQTYYQGDGSGDFSRKSVQMNKKRASSLPLKGPFRPFIYQPGESYIQRGSNKLTWNYKRKVGTMPADH